MNYLYFMVEEPSIKEVLNILLPQLLPEGCYKIISHDGKQDLEKSIPRKLRAIHWPPDAKFIVIRDQDSSDCIKVKERLHELCSRYGHDDALIRIVCRELESWYLGDLTAIEKAYGIKGLARKQIQAKYRDPDLLHNADDELEMLVPGYQKISGARAIASYMSLEKNVSHSFNVFIEGV